MATTSETLWTKRSSCETVSEPSGSRRCSTETIFSIQGRETDLLRDTSDTEWCGSDDGRDVEFEPVTEPEEEAVVNGDDSSGNSDNEIISTKVIEVVVRDDGDLEFADSEQTASGGSDSEMDFYDYWHCAQCRAQNNNPLYRYCEKCFKVRKNFFPPRPKRKHKLDAKVHSETITRTLSQDSGVEFASDVKRARTERSGSGSDSDVDDQTKNADDLKQKIDNNMCIMCYSEPKTGAFVHRRIAHICCCYKCARRVWAKAKRCPLCNCKVSNVLRAIVA